MIPGIDYKRFWCFNSSRPQRQMFVQTLVNGSDSRAVITMIQINFLEFCHSFYHAMRVIWNVIIMRILPEKPTPSLFRLPFCVCKIALGKGCSILFLCLLLFSCRFMYNVWGFWVSFWRLQAFPWIEPRLRGLRAKRWSHSSAQGLDTPAKV